MQKGWMKFKRCAGTQCTLHSSPRSLEISNCSRSFQLAKRHYLLVGKPITYRDWKSKMGQTFR